MQPPPGQVNSSPMGALENSRDTDATPRSRLDSNGQAFVYVAPCLHDSILKLGFSRDPLDRLRTFAPRWFAFFDIDAAFLIETERVVDARAIERTLGQQMIDHRAPAPLHVPRSAAGHTEWYRGALDPLREAASRIAGDLGFRVHDSLRTWMRGRLHRDRDRLFDWSLAQIDAIGRASAAGELSIARSIAGALALALDEFTAAQIDWHDAVPRAVAEWYVSGDRGGAVNEPRSSR